MHLTSLLEAASVFAAIATAAVVPPSNHVLHEKRQHRGHSRLTRRAPADSILPMRIGLKHNAAAIAQAEDWLMDVSHPSSPNFGKHWTQSQVIEAFRPTEHSVETVSSWLVSAGIERHRITHSENKLWLAFDATVEEAEGLLKTEYYHDGEHEDDESNDQVLVGSDAYHLPAHIQEHVDYVTPGVKATMMDLRRFRRTTTTKRSIPTSEKRNPLTGNKAKHTSKKLMTEVAKAKAGANAVSGELANCDELITPACIRALYHFSAPSPHATVSAANSMGIFEEGDYYDQPDLNSFFAVYTPYIKNGTHPKLDSIDGGVAPLPGMYGEESPLDFLIAYPIIFPQTITLYQTDDENYALGYTETKGIFNTFLDALDGSYCNYTAFGETGDCTVEACADPVYPDTKSPKKLHPYLGQLECGVYEPTNIISISYGVYEQDLPYFYQERQCNEYLKLALQGTTIVIASGDTGVGGYNYGTYGDGQYYGCLGADDNVFTPSQACSCPWVTNVGATEVFPGKTVFEPESAVLVQEPGLDGNYSSSGGFSNIFPIPKYQKSAVEHYFETADPPYPYYYNGDWQNATNGGVYNRNGHGIPDVAANGWNYPFWYNGTENTIGGTSMAAPIFASLLNRIVEERIKVGKGAIGFINPALYANPQVLNDITNGTNPGCGTEGFSSAAGWDPVTGLGTPNYPKMLELFLSLP
ncbi:protease s8 tripeptidyl peptidase [Xylariaceae sp. FL0255]|nr:protease s8 tripeptidyl peptidase [Xylariaceae sp. FL0255]